MPSHNHGLLEPFGQLAEAKVVAHEVRIGADGQPVLDQNGNVVPTGLLRIELLDRNEIREHVPYGLPMAGNSTYMGGLPEVGTICIVGWRAKNRPVILCFLPFGLDNVSEERGTVPTLEPGELLLQGSKTDLTDDKEKQIFAGPRLWFDRHGRIKLETTDYSLLAGYVLNGEFGTDPQLVEDPETNDPILFRERIGTTERRVSQNGSEVKITPGDRHERIGGNYYLEVGGDLIQTLRSGILLQDKKRNGLLITPDDTAQLQGNAKARVKSGGNVELEAHGNIAGTALGEIGYTAGTSFNLLAGGSIGMRSASPIGGLSLSAINAIDLTAVKGMNLNALLFSLLAASTEIRSAEIKIGPPIVPLVNPFVMGIELAAFMTALLSALVALSASVLPNPTGAAGLSTAATTFGTLLSSLPAMPFGSKIVKGI